MKREKQLLSLVSDRETAVLLTSYPALRYYGGEKIPEGSAILAGKFGFVYYVSWAAEKKNGLASLRNGLSPEVRRLEVEVSSLTMAEGELLKEALPVEILLSTELETRIFHQRQHKSPEEIKKIRQAQEITDRAFADSLNFIHEGMTDRELQKLIADMLWKEGSQMTSFNHVLGCGPDTADPHVRPTGRAAKRGDFIMMDIGALVDGYGSDMTRMVALGEVTDEQREIYELVRKAQAAGIAAVHAGAVCSEVDHAAREVIEQAGYGEFFPHGLGHPVGSGGLEGPRFSREDASILQPDIVMTVEPGIYLPGKFGVRIEDMVLVQEGRIEDLTHTSHELIIL